MDDQAKVSMMLCTALEQLEQEKVERLDGPISEAFLRAGQTVRICQSRIDGDCRWLDFMGPQGTIASIEANAFLEASDDEVVRIISESC